jgi:hypothetical protein
MTASAIASLQGQFRITRSISIRSKAAMTPKPTAVTPTRQPMRVNLHPFAGPTPPDFRHKYNEPTKERMETMCNATPHRSTRIKSGHQNRTAHAGSTNEVPYIHRPITHNPNATTMHIPPNPNSAFAQVQVHPLRAGMSADSVRQHPPQNASNKNDPPSKNISPWDSDDTDTTCGGDCGAYMLARSGRLDVRKQTLRFFSECSFYRKQSPLPPQLAFNTYTKGKGLRKVRPTVYVFPHSVVVRALGMVSIEGCYPYKVEAPLL